MVQQQTEVPEKVLLLEDVSAIPNLSPASEELETINLSSDPNVELSISISSSLSLSKKAQLIPLLKEYRDVYSWQYEEMLGLDPDLVVHALVDTSFCHLHFNYNVHGALRTKNPKNGP